MTESGQLQVPAENEDPTVVIFLGLYLLLLAFFILLNTISTIDENKSQQATDSVGIAFSEIMPDALRSKEELISKGAVLELDSYQGQVQAALATIIRLVETETTSGGQFRVKTSVEQIFDATGEGLIDDAVVFLDKIAKVLKRDEPGIRRELEVILGVGETLPEKIDAGSSLPMRQVTQFVHQLVEREVPAELISIGLGPGGEGSILMFFNPVDISGEDRQEGSGNE